MELIAATRVATAQQRSRAARPYSEQLTGVIEDLAASGADICLLYTSPSPRDQRGSRMPSSA